MREKVFAPISVVAGGVFWGVVALFVTQLNKIGLETMDISFIRMLVAAITICIILLIKDKNLFKIKVKDLPIIILNGLCCGVLFNFFYFYTIIHSEASVAVMLLYTSTIFVFIETMIIFKVKITKLQYACMILTILGCVFVSGVIGGDLHIEGISIFTGVMTGFVYGSFTVMTRYLTQKYEALTVTAYCFIVGLISMLPFSNIPHVFTTLSANPSYIPCAIGIGLVCSVCANLTFTWGIKYVRSSTAAILSASEPFTGAVVGMLILGESTEAIKIVGIVLVLCAIVLQAMEKDKS